MACRSDAIINKLWNRGLGISWTQIYHSTFCAFCVLPQVRSWGKDRFRMRFKRGYYNLAKLSIFRSGPSVCCLLFIICKCSISSGQVATILPYLRTHPKGENKSRVLENSCEARWRIRWGGFVVGFSVKSMPADWSPTTRPCLEYIHVLDNTRFAHNHDYINKNITNSLTLL